MQLASGYSFLSHDGKVHCVEPHADVKVGVLEYCSGKRGELAHAVLAVEFPVVIGLMVDVVVNASTFRADISVMEFLSHDVVNRRVLSGEPFSEFEVSHIIYP